MEITSYLLIATNPLQLILKNINHNLNHSISVWIVFKMWESMHLVRAKLSSCMIVVVNGENQT